jgi:drug/metabolite transporter (DMT)-like permease
MRVAEQGGFAGNGLARRSRLQHMRAGPFWGIGCLTAGIGVFSFQDVIIKLLSGAYPLHQLMTIRSVIAMPLLLIFVALETGLGGLASKRAGAVILRSLIMLLAYTAYYLGLPSLPLATAVSLYFASPLFITLLSVWLLAEQVGPRRWAAVLVGFVGVLVMVRPGGDLFSWASLLPVLASLAYGISQVLARKLGETESSTVMAAYGNFVLMVGGFGLSLVFGAGDFANEADPSFAFLLRGWRVPGAFDLSLMIFGGFVAAIGLTLLTEAYRAAEANVVAPFEYTALIWSVLFGWLFWDDLPNGADWGGMAIIIGAGLYLLARRR